MSSAACKADGRARLTILPTSMTPSRPIPPPNIQPTLNPTQRSRRRATPPFVVITPVRWNNVTVTYRSVRTVHFERASASTLLSTSRHRTGDFRRHHHLCAGRHHPYRGFFGPGPGGLLKSHAQRPCAIL